MKATTLYLLDTNTVGYIVSGRSSVARRTMIEQIQHSVIAISVLTEAEILYGLEKKPAATQLRARVEAFLSTVRMLPWDSDAARAYGTLRAKMSAAGKSLATVDMLIAAQAVAANAILVTNDKAFLQIDALRPTLNWATDLFEK